MQMSEVDPFWNDLGMANPSDFAPGTAFMTEHGEGAKGKA